MSTTGYWMWALLLGAALLTGCKDDGPDLPTRGGTRPRPPFNGFPSVDRGVVDARTDGAVGDASADVRIDGPAGCASSPGTITVTSSKIINLAAGSPMTGSVVVQLQGCGASCPTYLVTAGSWEDPALAASTSCDGPPGAGGSLTIDLGNKLAPQNPGTYQLIIAGRAGHDCLEVASASSAGAVFGDGNDITDWPVSGISGGSTCVDWLEAGQLVKVRVPAATVSVTVP